ncbi:HD domain-containing protein [bacterium]|nr:HD domain-containing protein [bacterium]
MEGKNKSQKWEFIEIAHLSSGMTLSCDVIYKDFVVLRKGNEISEDLLESLKSRNIEYVKVSPEAAKEIKSNARTAAAQSAGIPTSFLSPNGTTLLDMNERNVQKTVRSEFELEKELYDRADIHPAVDQRLLKLVSDSVEKTFTQMSKYNKLDINTLRGPVREMVLQSIARPNAAVKLIDVEHVEQYTVRHSVNVGLLFLAIARDYIPKEIMMDMTLAAILHDIGKARIPKELIEKRGPLTHDEFKLVKTHTLLGYKILMGKGGFKHDIADIALSHHERVDGSGYPRGTKKLSLAAQIAAVCDVYDALTTTRSYKTKTDFHSALNIIIKSAGKEFSRFAVKLMISRIGLYPIGTFVRLSSNEIGVVKKVNPEKIHCPHVAVLCGLNQEPLDHIRVMDIAENPNLTIANVLATRDIIKMNF